jgi:hypothetical protein
MQSKTEWFLPNGAEGLVYASHEERKAALRAIVSPEVFEAMTASLPLPQLPQNQTRYIKRIEP